MIYLKQFRVADLLVSPGDSTHHIFLCSPEGEYWRVAVDRLPDWQDLFRHGIILELPLILVLEWANEDRAMVPDWSAFGEDAAQRISLPNPFGMVCKCWGMEVANRHFSPDPPQAVAAPVPEAKPRRRSRKPDAGSPQNKDADEGK